MLPVLSHVENHEGLEFWVTNDGVCGVGFQIRACDIETESADDYGQRLLRVLRQIDPRILSRIKMEPVHDYNLDEEYPRANAFKNLGFKRKNIFLYLDFVGGIELLKEIKKYLLKKDSKIESEQFKVLLQTKALFEQYGFHLVPLTPHELVKLFDRGPSALTKTEKSIESGTQSIGVVRLLKQPLEGFSEEDWATIIDKMSHSVSINVSFRRMDEARAKLLLEKKLKQTKSGNDVLSSAQEISTEEMILKNFESGTQFFEIEILFVVERNSQAELSKTLSELVANVSMFSEAMIETYGVAPSFIATLPGSEQHLTIIETDQALVNFLPLWTYGEVDEQSGNAKRSLSLYRDDKSLYHFDLFNQNFNVFNTLIVGTSGKGKSVLTGLLTSSFLSDPTVTVIKLDVGGSHSKECELYGGEEYQLSLDRPSGINPFEVIEIESASDNDKLGILSNFLASLIQEEGEGSLTKLLKSEIESSVREYIDSTPQAPCLDEFYKYAKSFPRRDLLRRWTRGGLYEAAFSTKDSLDSNLVQLRPAGPPLSPAGPRLRYYNFSQIFQAADPEFAKAGVAAVLAQFNMEMLRANGQRLVLICDETPFFVKCCFDFFKFSTSNVRKYGHAVIPISQLSTQLIVGGDVGIIDNSTQRFIFSIDGDEREFQERFRLKDEDIRKIKSLRSIVGSFSEVLFQTGEVTRKLTVKVTPEEYWRLTTSRVDKEKLLNLLAAVPGLSLREGIRCLSAVDL